MRKLLTGIVLFISPFVFFCAAQNASANNNAKINQTVILAKDQIVNSDYIVKGNTVDILGTVNGDAYVAGGTVAVEGTINGDLLSIGGNINVKGNIAGNVRIVGGDIIITGNIGKNLSVLGGSSTLTETAKVGGSIAGAGGAFTFYGPVGKDIRVAGGQVTLKNAISGNVFAYVGQLKVSPNADIAGDVTYWSNQKAEVAPGAVIKGKTTQNVIPKKAAPRMESTKFTSIIPVIATFVIFGKIISFLASFIVGILFIRFFPICTQKVVSSIKTGFWKNVGIGLLITIVTPIIIVLLFCTLIGAPLAVFGGILFAFSLYVAHIVAGLVIGKWAIKYISKRDHVNWSLFIGLVIYGIVSVIPVLGWLFSMIFVAAGLGAILIEKKYSYVQLRAKNLI